MHCCNFHFALISLVRCLVFNSGSTVTWVWESGHFEAKTCCCSSALSSAVSSVISGVHQSLAELVRWSDQRLLYEDDTHNTRSIQDVVQMVKEAVQVRLCTRGKGVRDGGVGDSASVTSHSVCRMIKKCDLNRELVSVCCCYHGCCFPEGFAEYCLIL